ncbi:hypothetical protein SCLCIDRAFT_1217213 [Scleroderma citrinum Foug A]|uniref:Uncharacterized protein n=1 Tax=Scleroderma citrinum Foug A TaxID=1036808 RepID=A0A0C3A5H2_9AGAM|nr:hypothetical protein SCLCIDRAFT_1217213 [Scleroderma citrinum Foug A]
MSTCLPFYGFRIRRTYNPVPIRGQKSAVTMWMKGKQGVPTNRSRSQKTQEAGMD